MADLLSILSTAASSLSAQRAAAATAGNNLENAATPGYARQRAILGATLPAERVSNAWIGRGAELLGVTQARDRFLEAQVPAAFDRAARTSASASALESVTALDPDSGAGLGAAISSFYASLRAASQNAGDPNLREAVVGASQALAGAFQRTRAGLEDARTGLDAKVTGDVTEVNDLAQSVARLNGQIRQAFAAGGQPNDLLDARQKDLDRLAELTGAAPVPTSNGGLSVFAPGGAPLVVDDRASTATASADPANGGHLALTVSPPGGGPQRLEGLGGELGGMIDARDGALASAASAVDGLAFDLAGAVNAVHQAGYGLDGSTGTPLFTTTATAAGAAAAFSVSAAVAADPGKLAGASSAATLPGDAANFSALVATETQALSAGTDAAETLAGITSRFGAATRTDRTLADTDAALKDHLTSMRDSVSGVSIDEELVELQKSQRAYEAVAKVIQTSSDLFDTLLQLK